MADAQNPYADIEATATAQNPYAQLEGADPGALSDLAHGFKRGVIDVPSMAAQSGQFVGHAVHSAGAAVGSDSLENIGNTIAQHMAQSAQDAQSYQGPGSAQSAPGEEGGIVRRNVYGVGQALGQMGSVALAGAATGALVGSVVPGVGTIAGGIAGGSLALLGALPLLFAGSTAENTYEKIEKAATDSGMAPQDAENRAVGAGAVTGAIAGGGQFILQKIGLGKALEPIIEKVGAAAEGEIVKTALSQTLGNVAKGTAVAAAEGGATNAAIQGGVQGVEAGYGSGEGPTATGLIDAAVQGAGIAGVMHTATGVAQGVKVKSNVALMADPEANPNARANAALGAAALISTKAPEVGRDFALYAQNQIVKGQPIEVGPDAMYTGFADAIRQQQSDAQAASDHPASRTTQGAFPGFTPTGDEAASLAPDHVTDPNVQPPMAQPPQPVDATGRTTASQFPNFTPTGDELAAAARTVPQTAPPSITETIGTIMHAGSVDDAIAAAEQSIAGGAAAGIEHAQQMLHAAGVSRAAAVEAVPTPEALTADRAFYEEQAQRAQQDMRSQAFDQTQANITPPVPDNAFAQRQADLDAQNEALRTQGFRTGEQEQGARAAEQAPAVTDAQGFNEPAQPSTLSGAMGAELTRLGNRNLNNLTTTQLGALAAHHPDEAIRDQAAQIAAGRRNAALVENARAEVGVNPENVSTVSANGDMMHGVAAPARPDFSAERANQAADGLPVTRVAAGTAEPTTGEPVGAPARSLADTTPELQPLKAAMDSDARARGQNTAPGLVPVDTATLPEARTPAANGVEGATTLSQSDAGLLQKTAAIFGKKVVLFRQEGDTAGRSTDGAVLPGDAKTIYVNADASGAHHLVIVGHELAHQMQAEAPGLYKGMQDALLAHVGEGSQNDFYRYYMNRGDMTDEQVRQAVADPGVRQRMTDEFISDLVGNRFGEYRTWQQVFADAAGAKADRSMVYRIADFITSFINKLLANSGFRKFATDDMVGNLTAVRTQVRRALGEYATQAGTKPMQHEADLLRAGRDNRTEGTQPKLVEPVKAEPRADVGVEPSKAAPAPVVPREPEPAQGSQRIEPTGTPRTERAIESPERVNIPAAKEQTDERQGTGSAEGQGRGKPEAVPAASAEPQRLPGPGVVRGSAEWLAKQSRAHQGDDLSGLPSKVTIPGVGAVEFHSFKPAQDAARSYAEEHGIDYQPPKTYARVDPERATRIAQEFEAMQHDPRNPQVAAAYDAMIHETAQQYEAALKAGLKVEFIEPGQDDPYAMSPRLAMLDAANNNHMWVYSTREGFGSSEFDPVENPLLRETPYEISGQKALANDLFRVVHDYFGHVKDGVGFRADGEENAWRSHMAMYSDLARRAATTETRGQNSWVNYGPYAEANREASGADTHFADQKIGLLPEWVSEEGRGEDEPATVAGEDRAQANPLSSDPQVRASGERALYLGKLDAAQDAAARAVGAITQKQTYKQQIDALKKDLGMKLTQGIADQFYPIKKLDSEAYMQTRLSKGAESGGLEAMMLYGKPFLRDGVLDVNIHNGSGFAKTMSSLDGEHGRFFLWVAAQRAEQLKAQGKENLFTDNDISALKTLNKDDAQHPQREQKFDTALREYNDFNDSVIHIAEQSGLLDSATRQLFKDQPYVPFYRVMDEEDGMKGPGKSAGLVNQYAFKKLKGGTNALNQDLLANTLANWGHLLGAAAKNRAATLTLDAAEKVGAADKVSSTDAGKGSVKVMVNGKPQFYEVNDPHLLAAVSAMSAQVPSWMRPLAAFKRMLTTGTTLAPGFRIRNLIRDTLTVLGSSEIRMNPVANIAQGFRSMDHDSQTHASMLASGGIINFGTMLEGNEAARAHRLIQSGVDAATILNNKGALNTFWDKTKEAYDVYHEWGNKFENANRGALYEQLIAKGMSHAEASYQARDLMDFSLQGQNPVVRFLTTSVPFLNARIQGAYKIGRAVADNPLRAGTVMGSVAMASLGLMLAYQNDPDWKKRPDWDRDNYWWFKMGGTAYRIPKPFEVGAIGTLAERTWEKMFDPEMTNSRYVGELRDLLMNQFNLNPTPQIVRPLLNVYANRDDFTGNQIENTSLQSLQPEDRYTPYTSMTSRFLGSLGLPDPAQMMLGRYSKLSPVQMDSLVNGYFGWLGTSALTAVDAIVRPFSSNGAKPALQLRDYSMGFAENLPSNASRYQDTMYENLSRIQQAYASYHMAINTGQFAKAQDVLNTSRVFGPSNRTLVGQHEMAQNTATIEARLGQQERRILDSPSLSADTKRTMLNRINQQRNELAQSASNIELRREQQ